MKLLSKFRALSLSILFVFCFFPFSVCVGNEPFENELEVMKGIRTNTEDDFVRDDFNIIAIVSIMIALFSLGYSIMTYREQKKTESNTKKLSKDAQRELLNDLIRHLYRNYVKTYAIRTKLEDVEYKGYPSEDNFIKMYIPMENIHLEIFYGDKAYSIIHTLYLQLRNYNVEVQVASEHFKHQGIDMFTKKMDLDNLEFKVFFLTRRIMETEYEIWGNTDNVWSGMFNALMLGVNKKNDAKDNRMVEGAEKFTQVSENIIRNSIYTTLLGRNKSEKEVAEIISDFTQHLNTAIMNERMLNNRGAEKIHIVKYSL